MSVKVSVPLSKPISATVNQPNSINTNIASKKAAVKLDGLADTDVQGVQDGYTLIYNIETRKWEAVNASTGVIPSAIDGGTY